MATEKPTANESRTPPAYDLQWNHPRFRAIFSQELCISLALNMASQHALEYSTGALALSHLWIVNFPVSCNSVQTPPPTLGLLWDLKRKKQAGGLSQCFPDDNTMYSLFLFFWYILAPPSGGHLGEKGSLELSVTEVSMKEDKDSNPVSQENHLWQCAPTQTPILPP